MNKPTHFLLILLIFLNPVAAFANSDTHEKLMFIYSNDVRGEIEPCG
jgi:hypothetical protein